MLLTTGQVMALAKLPQSTLQRWLELGLVKPVNAGEGKHNRYTVQQAVALVYGVGLRDRLSCGIGWVEQAIKYVATMERERLEEEFAAGRTVVWVMPLGQTCMAKLTLPDDATPSAKALASNACLKTVWGRVERGLAGVQAKRKRALVAKAVKAGKTKKAKRVGN